jgi:outer membrane protein TolC
MRTLNGVIVAWLVLGIGRSAFAGEPAEPAARTRAEREPEVETFVIGGTSTTAAAPADGPNGRERTLPQLVTEALAANKRIKIDEAKIGEAIALLDWAKAQAYPRLDALAIGGGPTPERKLTTPNDPTSVTDDSKTGNFRFGQVGVTFQVNATAIQPIYTFGKLTSGKQAAEFVVRAAEDKHVITEAEVVVDVNRAFWGYQLAHSFVGSLQDGEKTLLKVQKKIEDLIEAESPQVTENDRLRMIHAIATVRVRLNEAVTATKFAVQAMKLLIGRVQESELEIANADLDELPAEIPPVESFIRSAHDQRPEVLALRNVVGAATKYTEFRKNRLWPDVFLGGEFDFAYTSNATRVTSPFLYNPYNTLGAGLGIGVRFELDVFTKLAELEQAEAELATHTAEEAAVDQAIDVEVRKIHTDLTAGYERIQLLERANRAARGWLTASTLAYDIGTGDARQLTESFLAWAASEAELQKTRFDMHIAHADYARAGGQLIHRRENAR